MNVIRSESPARKIVNNYHAGQAHARRLLEAHAVDGVIAAVFESLPFRFEAEEGTSAYASLLLIRAGALQVLGEAGIPQQEASRRTREYLLRAAASANGQGGLYRAVASRLEKYVPASDAPVC